MFSQTDSFFCIETASEDRREHLAQLPNSSIIVTPYLVVPKMLLKYSFAGRADLGKSHRIYTFFWPRWIHLRTCVKVTGTPLNTFVHLHLSLQEVTRFYRGFCTCMQIYQDSWHVIRISTRYRCQSWPDIFVCSTVKDVYDDYIYNALKYLFWSSWNDVRNRIVSWGEGESWLQNAEDYFGRSGDDLVMNESPNVS